MSNVTIFQNFSHIVPTLGENLPNVHTVMLTNNEIRELGDVEPLATFSRLEYLSLLGNPVVHKQHYRLYLIYKCPNLRVLDFKRVRESVRFYFAFSGAMLMHRLS